VLAGDEERGRQLYDLLLPHADDNAVSYTQQPFGPVALRLGKLAAMLGRWQEVDRHFATALARCELLGATAIRARVLLEHARALTARGEPADRSRIEALTAEARELCEQLQIPQLLAERSVVAERVEDAVFRREGDVWTIAYGADSFRLRDVKGLRYIAALLASPGREVHVLELAGGSPAGTQPVGAADGLVAGLPADGDPVLDEQAKRAYRERLVELESELDEAQAWADPERAAVVADEIELLREELARAVGLGGRDRRFASPAERARVSVTKAIRTAIRLIDNECPALAKHLEASIQTGRFCSYSTPGAPPPRWSV
jgi:hypothetical protein